MDKNLTKINELINTKILGQEKLKADFTTLEIIDEISELSKNLDNDICHINFELSKEYYKAVDKRIKKIIKNQNLACRISCSKCCEDIHFLLPRIEIDNIVIALNNFNDSNVKDIIGQKIKFLYENYKHKAINANYNFDNSIDGVNYVLSVFKRESEIIYNCPFLIENKCSIYENRPVICRTYLSKSYDKCLDNNADSVIYTVLNKSLSDLNYHYKNKHLPSETAYLDMSVPFFIIRYDNENKKFYSINKFNKFSYYLQRYIK